jgi:hypothetical protein
MSNTGTTDAKTSEDALQLGAARRKNGHKMDCGCHICENMRAKAKVGGYKEDVKRAREKAKGWSRKKNGHKNDCNCPICRNMRNSKKKGGEQKNKMEGELEYEKVADDNGEEEDELSVLEKGIAKPDPLELLEEGRLQLKNAVNPTLSDMEEGRAGYEEARGGTRKRRRGKRAKKTLRRRRVKKSNRRR